MFDVEGHNHRIEIRDFELGGELATSDATQTNPQESRIKSVQRCVKYLIQACHCKDIDCSLPGCMKMKILVLQSKICTQRANGCLVCNQLATLCYCHAQYCQKAKCLVYLCNDFKYKIKQRTLQGAQILDQPFQEMLDDVLQSKFGNSNTSSQPSPGAQPHLSLHPPQSGKRSHCSGSQSEDLPNCSKVVPVKHVYPVPKGIATLQKNLEELLHCGVDYDMIIKVKGCEYKAHKNILQARCSVFSAMFMHKMKECLDNSITIEDCDPQVFTRLLEYIYTGKVENLNAYTTIGLYYACDKYDIPCLKEVCRKFLKASLSTENICSTIVLAIKHSDVDLLQHTISFFWDHSDKIIGSVAWTKFLIYNQTQACMLFDKELKPMKSKRIN